MNLATAVAVTFLKLSSPYYSIPASPIVQVQQGSLTRYSVQIEKGETIKDALVHFEKAGVPDYVELEKKVLAIYGEFQFPEATQFSAVYDGLSWQ